MKKIMIFTVVSMLAVILLVGCKSNEGTSILYKNVSREFVIGNHVEIYIEGGIRESYPMQGLATAVYVNEANK